MRQIRQALLVAVALIFSGCSIDTNTPHEHWASEAAEFFSERRDLDDVQMWLEEVASNAQPANLGFVDGHGGGTYVATLEDLGDNWVCRYWVILDMRVDATGLVTDHTVDVRSACL